MIYAVTGATESGINLSRESSAHTLTKPYPWIVGRNFDFFFICGGLVWILIALNYILIGLTVPPSVTQGPMAGRWLLILVLWGQHLSADAHNAATYMRIYGGNEDRQRFHFYGKWLALACLPIFLCGITIPGLGGAMVYLYLITVYWHYAAQVFGISLIYCYKQGYTLSRIEREIFRWLILSMSAVVGLRLVTYRDYGPTNFYGVPIPFWGPLPEQIVNVTTGIFVALCLAFSIVIVKKLLTERRMMPWTALLCVCTLALLGFSKGMISSLAWFYVPVFFHGSQYLAICLTYYLKERGLPQGMIPSEILSMILTPMAFKYLGTVIVVGAFLYVVIPHLFQSLGFNYDLVAGVVLATVNFHHFNTDAAIWRLRDPSCREILLA